MSDVHDKPETKKRQIEASPNSKDEEGHSPPMTLWAEFCYLLVHDKKWWLFPILLGLAILLFAVMYSKSNQVPFIYNLH